MRTGERSSDGVSGEGGRVGGVEGEPTGRVGG